MLFLIGLQNSLQNKILYNTKGYVEDYDENVNPTVLNEHATAAFRFFHSLIQGNLEWVSSSFNYAVKSTVFVIFSLIEEHRHSYGNIRLSDWFNRPLVLEQGNNFDDLTRGMGTQPQSASDEHHTSEVSYPKLPSVEYWIIRSSFQITQFLFRNRMPFGQDLKTLDIQRNRDHGLASYNDYRKFCGLPKAYSFHDFLDLIAPEVLSSNIQPARNIFILFL